MRPWLPVLSFCALAAVVDAAAAPEVAVDVGHTVEKPGAISASGKPEFEFNLGLATDLRASLESAGLRVRMIGWASRARSPTKSMECTIW